MEITLYGPITLMLLILLPNGESRLDFKAQPTSDACQLAIKRFLLTNPVDYGAIALGAGCIIHPDGKDAQNEPKP